MRSQTPIAGARLRIEGIGDSRNYIWLRGRIYRWVRGPGHCSGACSGPRASRQADATRDTRVTGHGTSRLRPVRDGNARFRRRGEHVEGSMRCFAQIELAYHSGP